MLRHRFRVLSLIVGLLLAACVEAPEATLTSNPSPTVRPTSVASSTATSTPTVTTTATIPPSPTLVPPTTTPKTTATTTATATPRAVVFAVIGDYGLAGTPEAEVAALVHGWDPDFIITTGDNNYPNGAYETIDENIGQYYADYIYPYSGEFATAGTVETNRFFPSLGNHDYVTDDAQPYLDYFTLPGNERYYDVEWWPVHLFSVNNNWAEPDGVRADSVQGQWLQEALADSRTPWKIVYMHVPPYSSGQHGSNPVSRWPYAEWGASAVLAGHDHVYERLEVDGLPYFVNGVGGYPAIYPFVEILPSSLVRFNEEYGAMRVEATETTITFEFVTQDGELIDQLTLTVDG